MTPTKLLFFSTLIVISVILIKLTAGEEIEQPRIINANKETKKNTYWGKNKWHSPERKKQVKIFTIFILFIVNILIIHLIA